MSKFKKGQSGNPAGRKPGTSIAAKLRGAIDADLPDVLAVLVEIAKAGDTAAAKLLLDRTLPTLKPIQQAGKIAGVAGKSLTEQAQLIVNASSDGYISTEQAQQLLAGLGSLVRIQAADEFERRLQALEKKSEPRSTKAS